MGCGTDICTSNLRAHLNNRLTDLMIVYEALYYYHNMGKISWGWESGGGGSGEITDPMELHHKIQNKEKRLWKRETHQINSIIVHKLCLKSIFQPAQNKGVPKQSTESSWETKIRIEVNKTVGSCWVGNHRVRSCGRSPYKSPTNTQLKLCYQNKGLQV